MEETLLIISPGAPIREFSLNGSIKSQVVIGRSPEKCDIVLDSGMVSHVHGKITIRDQKVWYEDLGSNNGTYVDVLRNKKYLKDTKTAVELRDGMVLNIGGMGKPSSVYLLYSVCGAGEAWKRISLNRKPLNMGRAADNDIVLSHPAVSRLHASVTPSESGYVLADMSRKNGLLVNGKPVRDSLKLEEGSIIQIAAFQLIYIQDSIFYKTVSHGISMTVEKLNKVVGQNKVLLHDVNCQIESNEFVAIIGGSGAGKTTLMNAISGFDKSITGRVYLNGLDLAKNFKYLKSVIGYVPQEDIIYENLTLQRMLEYTARLKMPSDITAEERQRQITRVLEMVDLKPQKDTYIRKLSGGQKKRASIAVELLGDPRLFFLDEPTSGLDPGTEQSLMRTLNRLSKTQEKTIIMVTHTIQNLDLCDRIIFMGAGGRLCFSGTVQEAKMFFDTENLADAYNMISADSASWEAQFDKFQKKGYQTEMDGAGKSDIKMPGRRVSAIRQLSILVQRYMELIKNDWGRLLLLLAQPVVIGLMLKIVADDTVFDIYENTKTMMFALCCAGIWIGLFNAIQEVCKERNILKREYMGSLKLGVYIFSKFFVQALIGLIQSGLLCGVFLALIGKKGPGVYLDNFGLEIIFTIWLVILSSEALGLLVSANFRSGDKAMVAAPFLLIVQLLFSGILFKLEGPGEILSYATLSRWTMQALGGIVNLNSLPLKMQAEYPMIEHEAETFFEATKAHVSHGWWVLLGMTALFLIAGAVSLRGLSRDKR